MAGAQKSGGIEAQEGQMINQVLNMQVRPYVRFLFVWCIVFYVCMDACTAGPPDRPLTIQHQIRLHTLTQPQRIDQPQTPDPHLQSTVTQRPKITGEARLGGHVPPRGRGGARQARNAAPATGMHDFFVKMRFV